MRPVARINAFEVNRWRQEPEWIEIGPFAQKGEPV